MILRRRGTPNSPRDAIPIEAEQRTELRQLLAGLDRVTEPGDIVCGDTIRLALRVSMHGAAHAAEITLQLFDSSGSRVVLDRPVVCRAERGEDERYVRVSQTTRRHDVVLPGVPGGGLYRLRLPDALGQGGVRFAASNATVRLAASSTTDSGIARVDVYESPDGRLRMTLRRALTSETIVAIETNEACLADGAAAFYLTAPGDGRVAAYGIVRLDAVPKEPLWEGRWIRSIDLPDEFDVLFHDCA